MNFPRTSMNFPKTTDNRIKPYIFPTNTTPVNISIILMLLKGGLVVAIVP